MRVMISRREVLAGAAALWFPANGVAARDNSSLLIISAAEGKRMRDAFHRSPSTGLDQLTEKALHSGPWSVTFDRPSPASTKAGPNDYFSEGPYWWPNPQDPNGPYIRKDGVRNGGRFTKNEVALKEMSQAVLALGIGDYFLGNPACAAHANNILATWFVDPKTRMNPNLEYGQAIRGVTTGRGTGIIDTVSLIYCAQGTALLECSGALDKTIWAGVQQWFAAYLHWMTSSPKGQDEKMSGNNHATWWTAQAAAYAVLTGDLATQRKAWGHYREYLVPTEIRPDGSCPREEARTKSLGYSSMNLDAFAVICRLAQVTGVDLWHYKAPNGVGVEKAFNYLMPYVLHPNEWRKQQIEPYSGSSTVFPALAALGLPSPELHTAYKQIPHAQSPWVQFVDLIINISA